MKRFLPLLRIFAAVLLGAALLFSCEKPLEEPNNQGGGGQKEPDVELKFSAEKFAFSSYRGSQQGTVTTNQTSWTATVSDAAKGWITITTEGSTVTVSVQENTGNADRTGTVTISAGGKKIDIPVSQDAAAEAPAGGENMKVSYTLKEGTTIAPKALASYIKAHDAEALTFTIGKDVPKELLPAANAP